MRRRVAAALLLVFSAGAAALASEWTLRWLRPGLVLGRAAEASLPFWRHDPELGWFHLPGARGVFSRPEFSHRVTINAVGFRDTDWLPSVTSGRRARRFRIAVFGDSFAWGHGVEDEEIFSRILRDLLPGVEVWNLGVSGYSTDQELLLFRRVGRDLEADLVLVLLARNDFEGNVSAAWWNYPKPLFVEKGGRLELANVPVPEPTAWRCAVTAARRRSALVNGVFTVLGDRGIVAWPAQEGREGQIRMTLRLLEAFAAEAAEAGSEFAVALVPTRAFVYREEVPELEALRYDAVKRWGRERGLQVLDLVPAFREAFLDRGALLHYEKDGHWDAAGHRLAAETLAVMLPEAGLIPSGDGGPRPEVRPEDAMPRAIASTARGGIENSPDPR